MMIGRVLATLATAMILVGASPDDGFESLWRKHQSLLADLGISKSLAKQLVIWNDAQYYIGYCRDRISAEDILHWRTWWKNTPVEQSEFGQKFLKMGDDSYQSGVRDGSKKPFTTHQCQRLTDRWLTDMKNAIVDDTTAARQ